MFSPAVESEYANQGSDVDISTDCDDRSDGGGDRTPLPGYFWVAGDGRRAKMHRDHHKERSGQQSFSQSKRGHDIASPNTLT